MFRYFLAICDPPCKHGGTCTRPYTCSCPVGRFTGPNCDKRNQFFYLFAEIYFHQSTLESGIYVHVLNIVQLYLILFITTAICSPLCLNGGTCLDSRICQCPFTYTGIDCGTRE